MSKLFEPTVPMKKNEFVQAYLPSAIRAGEAFNLNPVVILAQAAIESGWGQSFLAAEHHNFFGITAYGKKNEWWNGTSVCPGEKSLSFRSYPDAAHSFMDYARLIRTAYPSAANVSHNPQQFAREISYSKYISEVNGDNREAYRHLLVTLCRSITKILGNTIPPGK